MNAAVTPYAGFLTCNKPSGEDGGDCTNGFNPSFSVTLPSVGIPQVSVDVPSFSGISIEAIMKAFELLGLDPCAFSAALQGAITSFVDELESALQGALDGVAAIPAEVINEINAQAQTALNGLLAPVEPYIDLLNEPCEGTIAGIDQALQGISALAQAGVGNGGNTDPITGNPIFEWNDSDGFSISRYDSDGNLIT